MVVGQVNFYIDENLTQSKSRNKAFVTAQTKFFNEDKKDNKNSEKSKLLETTKGKMLFKIMTNGSYFGEVDIIFRRKRVYDLVTAMDCDFYILSRTEFENIVMNEYPHIYQEMKQLAFKREERDLEMIKDSLVRVNPNDPERIDSSYNSIRKMFQNSICTEVDNHEIAPLEEMFEDMKEKLPLEELLDNFEVSNSEDEKDDENDDDLDSSEVSFTDVRSYGLDNMYKQFKNLNTNLKNNNDIQDKFAEMEQARKGGARRGRAGGRSAGRVPTYINNAKPFVMKVDGQTSNGNNLQVPGNEGSHHRRNGGFNEMLESNKDLQSLQKKVPQESTPKPKARRNTFRRDTSNGDENRNKLVGSLAKHAENISGRMNELLKRSEKLNDNAKKLSGQIDNMLRE